jgi:sulfide:quinone oxidoreductase
MKRLIVLGAGTAGTMAVNKLRLRLPPHEWSITMVDQDDSHHYQPGYLFVPFGGYAPEELVKPRRDFLPDDIELIVSGIDLVLPEENRVTLTDGRSLEYDYLVIATGTSPRPEETEGMTGPEWNRSIFSFFTLEGAAALGGHLADWPGGRLVVQIVEMPIKCPVAPLEFSFLADAFFTQRKMRDKVEIIYVTPMDAAFTKPVAAKHLGGMLSKRGIALETDFMVDRIDNDTKTLVSMDEREIPFDLLVTIPLNMGADYLARSGLGNELNYVAVDKHTLLSKKYDNIFAIGDAADLPTSKAGSVAHFSMEQFPDNFVNHVNGRPMTQFFDGHANCFIETGHGKGMLIDFNYDTEPLTGKYPVPGIGPFTLLKESRENHWGKLAFRWMYWNVLLPGRPIPLNSEMSMAGKHEEVLT